MLLSILTKLKNVQHRLCCRNFDLIAITLHIPPGTNSICVYYYSLLAHKFSAYGTIDYGPIYCLLNNYFTYVYILISMSYFTLWVTILPGIDCKKYKHTPYFGYSQPKRIVILRAQVVLSFVLPSAGIWCGRDQSHFPVWSAFLWIVSSIDKLQNIH